VIPQPENTIDPQATKTIAISAHATPNFGFTPNSFTVNQGDIVTISLSVASNDGAAVNNPAHALIMDTYVEQQLNCNKGQTVTRTFTATTAGTFPFACIQSACGIGHSSMIGQMIVTAVTTPSITGLTPVTGSITGGTSVTISGTNFSTSGTTTVTFGGSSATNVAVSNSTTITATTPVHAVGVVDVVVNNNGQSATANGAFTYQTIPPRHRSAKH
jgi:hypothetical protein